MSARIELQAPSTSRPWAVPWVATALALLLAAAGLMWALTRSAGPTAVPQPRPGLSTVSHQDHGGPGLVNTGGVTRPMPYDPVAPAVAPRAPAAPAAPAAAEAPQAAGGWYFHMVSTGGVSHPAPSS